MHCTPARMKSRQQNPQLFFTSPAAYVSLASALMQRTSSPAHEGRSMRRSWSALIVLVGGVALLVRCGRLLLGGQQLDSPLVLSHALHLMHIPFLSTWPCVLLRLVRGYCSTATQTHYLKRKMPSPWPKGPLVLTRLLRLGAAVRGYP